jgi:outer membrane immunogenic protein
MRRVALAVAATTALSIAALGAGMQNASAADMPVKADPLFNWTGWYVGGNTGHSWGRAHNRHATFEAVNLRNPDTQVRIRGWQGSVEGGYCWQYRPQTPYMRAAINVPWVSCVEANFNLGRERGSGSSFVPGVITGTFNQIDKTESVDWVLTLGPKLGPVLDNNRLYLFVTGGAAFGKVKLSAINTFSSGTFTVIDERSVSRIRTGWFVGAGLERMINRHWGIKFHYSYVDLGRTSVDVYPFGPTPATVSSNIYDHILSVGANYHF